MDLYELWMEGISMSTSKIERVVFRKWKDTGEVIAFLIDETEMGYVRSYMHVG